MSKSFNNILADAEEVARRSFPAMQARDRSRHLERSLAFLSLGLNKAEQTLWRYADETNGDPAPPVPLAQGDEVAASAGKTPDAERKSCASKIPDAAREEMTTVEPDTKRVKLMIDCEKYCLPQ